MRSLSLPSVAATALLCACKFSGPPGGLTDGAAADADPGDGGVVTGDAIPCEDRWAPDHTDPCDPPPVNNALVIGSDASYNTETNELKSASGNSSPNTIVLTDLDPNVRVLFVQSLEIQDGATLSVSGSMPLLLASNDFVTIAGSLTVASVGTGEGAGSGTSDCATNPPQVGEDDGGGAGGGGGGAYQGDGGDGGDGNNDGGGSAGGNGGTARAVPTSPAGGCPGARGGAGGAMDFGLGGAGGGALQLSARNRIAVTGDGAIDAGGGGGRGAQGDDCGGGGGGSGGYIRLDCADIDVLDNATVTANGGGGGGGSTGGAGANGSPGQDGQRSAAAAGGGPSSGASSSDGAPGGAGTSVGGASQNNTANGGAGGGGGAAGYVVIPTANLELGASAIISPDPTEPP